MSKRQILFLNITLVYLLIAIAFYIKDTHKQPTIKNSQADKILIEKSKRALTLLKDNIILKTYHISLGHNSIGKKIQKGDYKTPEGIYSIDSKNPSNRYYYMSLHISYPNQADIENAKKLGVDPGSAVLIHGTGRGHIGLSELGYNADWTEGCIAVTDKEIAEIYYAVPIDIPVEILP